MSRRLAIAIALTLALSATAAAYLSAGGSGGGSGAVSTTLSPVTITAGIPTGALYPGGSASVAAVLGNPNDDPVRIRRLQLDVTRGNDGFAVDSAHAGCATSALSFTTQSAGWTAPAGGSLELDLTGALSMDVNAADACQGARFTVHLEAVGA